MSYQHHIPEAHERNLVIRILGKDASCHPVVQTHHPITRWEAHGRAIATKFFTTKEAYETELRILQCLGNTACAFAPDLLAHGEQVIAMDWIPGKQFIDRFDPGDIAPYGDIFVKAAETIGLLHEAGSVIEKKLLRDATADVIPGPRGFVHGDTLPHNISVDDNGRVFILDFEKCSWGHSLLDLAPLACVMHADTRERMLHRYCDVRRWTCTPEIVNAYRTITRTWPRLFIKRFDEVDLRKVFMHAPDRGVKLKDWCKAGIVATDEESQRDASISRTAPNKIV